METEKLGYSETPAGNVTITMTPDDYNGLLFTLGCYAGTIAEDRQRFYRHVARLNRLNAGNPYYRPYQIPEESRG